MSDEEEFEEPYLYHVTYAAYVESIAEDGLQPNRYSSMGGVALNNHKRNRVFVCEASGLRYWHMRSSQWAEHEYEDWKEIGLVSVVLRIPNGGFDDIEIDEDGTTDSRHGAWMISGEVPGPIEIYVDGEWISAYDWCDEFIEYAFDEDGDPLDDAANGLIPVE